MASLSTINESEFEARWKDAVSLVEMHQVDLSPDDPAEFPEYLLPQRILDWIKEVADACSQEGLIDDKQHGALVCNVREQSTIFSRIDQNALKAIVARIDAAKTNTV